MQLTVEHIIEQVSSLTPDREYGYVNPSNKNKIMLKSVSPGGPVRLVRRNSIKGEDQPVVVSADSLGKIAAAVTDRHPFNIDAIVNGSGNWRSPFDSLLALCPEFYCCRVNDQHHLVWLPDNPHDPGVIKDAAEDQYVVDTAYKSTMEIVNEDFNKDYGEDYLAGKLAEYYDKSNDATAELFGLKYGKSLRRYSDDSGKLRSFADGSGVQGAAGAADGILRGVRLYELIEKNYAGLRFTGKSPAGAAPAAVHVPADRADLVNAIKTKPFIILAGNSGTGKSRVVRELAFRTCPKSLQDRDGTTPGNYCMVEVKPNWHDSTELLGYYSTLSGRYVVSRFDRFVAKAWQHTDTPFLVCLDEMNLAPAEQYFAEFLSVLETRSRSAADGRISTGAIIDRKYFADGWTAMAADLGLCGNQDEDSTRDLTDGLRENGLTLPPNLIVIGTVNMDDTTYQFSRKVIDRAMTIEMNGGKLSDMFGRSSDLAYRRSDDAPDHTFDVRYINADEVLAAWPQYSDRIRSTLPDRLDRINGILSGTPFQVSYRVLNELVIYLGVLLDEAKARGENTDGSFDGLADTAVDNITMMKILPRIEGDRDLFEESGKKNKLEQLLDLFPVTSKSHGKLGEMISRLERSEFTRFWP